MNVYHYVQIILTMIQVGFVKIVRRHVITVFLIQFVKAVKMIFIIIVYLKNHILGNECISLCPDYTYNDSSGIC